MSDWAYVNGSLMRGDEATVSIYDRGFLYGDSVFETLRTYKRRAHALTAHLDRLEASAEQIAMALDYSRAELKTGVAAVLERRRDAESYLRIIISRGEGSFGLDPDLAEDQTLVILARPLPPQSPDFWRRGVTAISVRESKRRRGEVIAKTGNYLTNLLALRQARRAGAHEALRFDNAGELTEGSTSNVFAVIDGVLCTPDIEAGLLPGITRQYLLDAAKRINLPLRVGAMNHAAVAGAEELMISSTLRELVAVVRLDDVAVGDGQPGPVCRALHAAYRESCNDD